MNLVEGLAALLGAILISAAIGAIAGDLAAMRRDSIDAARRRRALDALAELYRHKRGQLMFGPLALTVNAVARMTVRYGSLAELVSLTEVTIRNWVSDSDAFGGGRTGLCAEAADWSAAYDAGYSSGNIYWRDICRLIPVTEPARVCLCDFPDGEAHLSSVHAEPAVAP